MKSVEIEVSSGDGDKNSPNEFLVDSSSGIRASIKQADAPSDFDDSGVNIITGTKDKGSLSKKNKIVAIVGSIIIILALIAGLIFLAFNSLNKNSFGDYDALKKLNITVPDNKKEALTVDENTLNGIEKIDKASGVVLKHGSGETISVGRQANVKYLMYAYTSKKITPEGEDSSKDGQSAEANAAKDENTEKKWSQFMSSWDMNESMPVEIFGDEDKLLSQIPAGGQVDPTAYRLSKLCNGEKVGAAFALFMPSSETGDDAEILVIGEVLSQTDLNVDPDAPKINLNVPSNAPEVKFDGNGKPTGLEVPNGFQKDDNVYVKVLTPGNGDEITQDSTISVHYTGWLLNGTKFDSSYDHSDKPVEIALPDVIKGWRYGIAGQKVGAKLEILIPSEYGYGKHAAGDVPADSYLVFYVDIDKINPENTGNGQQELPPAN
ncbi:MAG: FKBP-type peptidyl-prolyl cis-trans isomerase [Candidatus Ancillula sp.]|jgi:hypothetical protein|nr:FKBP-type peptidyl-prolyl cis-trans isomerase [Candidatus Ancillula sp.]